MFKRPSDSNHHQSNYVTKTKGNLVDNADDGSSDEESSIFTFNSVLAARDIEVPAWLLPYHGQRPATEMSEKSVGSEDWMRVLSPSSSDDEVERLIQDINDNVPVPHYPTTRTHASPNSHNQAPSVVQAEANTSRVQIPDNFQEGGDTYVIAHDAHVQALMDKHELAWGVQYELARGVCDGRWSWEEVTEDKVERMSGSNQNSAASISAIMRGFSEVGTSSFSRNIWVELDIEHAAMLEDQYRGLGLRGEFEGQSDWYGGKVQQRATLVQTDNSKMPFQLKLERMEMRKSTKFARFLGSRRLLQFKLPSKGFDDCESFLLKRFILCGRVYVCICAKDKKIYAIEVNEDYQRLPQKCQGDHLRYSFEGFIEWYNPLKLNKQKSVSKWVARFDLGLSTSVPALEFKPGNIFRLQDQHAHPYENDDDPPADKIYTDGCGFMNGAALMAISRQIGYTDPPVAIQGRILGSKGVWVLHYSDRTPSEEPKIWIRDSQIKIMLTEFTKDGKFDPTQLERLHPSHLIFDLVQPSRVSHPARLGKHTIMNLSHNGVPTDVLKTLMEDSLEEQIAPFMQWTGPHAMELLWNAVNTSGRVSLTRLQRQAAGASRALGLSGRFGGDEESDSEDSEDESPASSPASTQSSTFNDVMAASQDTLAESILRMLQSGFSPLDNLKLYEELKVLVKLNIESFIKEYHIVLDQSADTFIIPDPWNVLGEREIHFKSSKNLKDPLIHMKPNQLMNEEVLLWRNPARLPSDVQKVKAVQHAQLADLVDVIVLPVTGPCSMASLLAGGDYDGDTAVCVFDPVLVKNFTPPPVTREPPGFKQINFESLSSSPTIQTLRETMSYNPQSRQRLLQTYLLKGFVNNRIWQYSNFHENAAYAFGFDSKETIHNAFMFNYVLDSRKSGLVVKKEVFETDERAFGKAPPPCLAKKGKPPSGATMRRDRSLPPFILDELLAAGLELQRQHLKKYQELWTGYSDREIPDPQLLEPYLNAQAFADRVPLIQEDLNIITRHVDECQQGWRAIWNKDERLATYESAAKTKEKNKMNRSKLTKLIQKFDMIPEGVDILKNLNVLDAIKASYAYSRGTKFGYGVAMKHLCDIKAKARGSTPFVTSFAETMSISSAAARILERSAQDMEE